MKHKLKVKVYILRSDIYTIFNPPVTVPSKGHTQLEQSHLPWDNAANTSYKYAGSLSHSVTMLVHYLPITARKYAIRSRRNRALDLFILIPTPFPSGHMLPHVSLASRRCHYISACLTDIQCGTIC